MTRQYEDDNILRYVNSLVPSELKNKFNKSNNEITSLLNAIRPLLYWFKKDFMHWMDKNPLCINCNIPMVLQFAKGSSWKIRSIEYYYCHKCSFTQNFPRYGEVVKVADSRIGRCSEWSFLFGAILNSLSIKTRIVHDFLDHCWNEAFTGGRWIHIDSTLEFPISFDHPYYYEKNWNKKYLYVLAFSSKNVEDITSSYSMQWKNVIGRRDRRKTNNISNIQKAYVSL